MARTTIDPIPDESFGRRMARVHLGVAENQVKKALIALHDHAPGYAGEVESVQEAIQNAMKILSGGSPE